MGIYDSSKTRVRPVFDKLLASNSSGEAWLPALLALPQRFDGVRPALPADLGTITGHAWSPIERQLPPPRSLLRWLIEHPPTDINDLGTSSTEKREKRRLLFTGDGPTRDEALSLLDKPRPGADWHIFEGLTSVDAYIETSRAIILVEGKRTESGPTTNTKWMPVRHQMLRNIDAAWDARGDRSVFGFFIVGSDGEIDVPRAWQDFSRETVSGAALAGSLPHRSDTEREAIGRSFAGATTWGAACAACGLDYRGLPNEA